MEIHKTFLQTELGTLEICGTENGLTAVNFLESQPESSSEVHPCLQEAVEQLREYFRGERREFSVQLQLEGTDFQKQVWQALAKIPFGETASYQSIANEIGNKKAVRAVGSANSQNKIPIIIPCHRVIGSNQKLIGYAGGVWRKSWLLAHEQKISSRLNSNAGHQIAIL